MASGNIDEGSGGKDGVREKQRFTESKVYTRKAYRGTKNNINNLTSAAARATNATTAANDNSNDKDKNLTTPNATETTTNAATSTAVEISDENGYNDGKKEKNNDSDTILVQESKTPRIEDTNSAQQPSLLTPATNSDDSSVLNRQQDAPAVSNNVPEPATVANSLPEPAAVANSVPEPAAASATDTTSNPDTSTAVEIRDENGYKDGKREKNNDSDTIQVQESKTPRIEDTNSAQQPSLLPPTANSDDSSVLNRQQEAPAVSNSVPEPAAVANVVLEPASVAKSVPEPEAVANSVQEPASVTSSVPETASVANSVVEPSSVANSVLEPAAAVANSVLEPTALANNVLEPAAVSSSVEPAAVSNSVEPAAVANIVVEPTSLANSVPEPPAAAAAAAAAAAVASNVVDPASVANVVREHVAVANGLSELTAVTNRVAKQGLENKVKINLALKSKLEKNELKRKLESELDIVRILVKKIEAKGLVSAVRLSNNSQVTLNNRFDNGLKRNISEMGSMAIPRESATPILTPTPRQSRPLNQLSISVLENSQGPGEFVEREKRTPKANQFYRNSEFLLAKDKFPPAESNKKSKLNVKRQGGGDLGFGFSTGTKMFKNCSALLEKLMKHKYGWVFNTPVDVKGLCLYDYYTIIKHPMDLGTIKSKLNKNWYKSPEEFAEDVRLTFHNAMTYNPEGQDAHVMAEVLLQIFEDRWAVIKSEYDHEVRFPSSYDLVATPTSRKTSLLPTPLDMRRIFDRSESVYDQRPKPMSTTPSTRTPAPKKPKAKDPNKRDMTYDEKQKLSTNLQSLPLEKLDSIVQIIKKRNSSLSQHGDEIEVDIDSVDAETLWELDRFYTNYKKSLSKNKRKAELAKARAEAAQQAQQKVPTGVLTGAPKETITADERNTTTSSPVQVGNQGDNGTRSSSSSSSSSDSGSSSSDSDSDSSSASGSDVGN